MKTSRADAANADIIAFATAYQIDNSEIDIENTLIHNVVSNESDISEVILYFSLSSGATLYQGSQGITSGVSSVDFSSGVQRFTVTAQDGTRKDWQISVQRIKDLDNIALEQATEVAVSVCPNPATDIANCFVTGLPDETYSISLRTASGTLIALDIEKGEQICSQFSLSGLPPGVYFIAIKSMSVNTVRSIAVK